MSKLKGEGATKVVAAIQGANHFNKAKIYPYCNEGGI